MSTAIRSSFVDHSGLDGTGDAINGSEVDENPNVVADILDGTLATDLAGAGTIDFVMTDTRAGIRLIDLSNAAAAIHEGLVLEWDPGDGGNLTDNSSGIGIDFKLPDDADTQTVFGSLNVVCVDDAAASTDGEFSFRVTAAGTDNVEQMTLSAAALTVVPNIIGTIDGTSTLADGVVATTQSASDNSTKVATTAYADAAATAAGITFNNDANNRIVTGDGSGGLNGEANLTFDGTTMNVVGNAGVGIARTDGTLHVHTASAGVVAAASTADDLVVEHAVEGGISILGGVTVDSHLTMGASNDNAGFDLQYNHTSGAMKWSIAGSDEALTATGARWAIKDTTNANQAIGLTINQLTQDNEILAFKSSDVAHGMTSICETDTYGFMRKQSATEGGWFLTALSEGQFAFSFQGIVTTVNTGKTTAAYSPFDFDSYQKSGTSQTGVGADGNIVNFRSNGATRFIFDNEGSAHADVEWTTYDTYNDLALISDMEDTLLAMEAPDQTPRRHTMEATGIIGKDSWHMENGKPRAMVNFSKLAMLHHGALIQVGDRFRAMEEAHAQKIAELKGQLNLLMERN
jgi:hypothetical protein